MALDAAFLDQATKEKLQESLAHFVSSFVSFE